MVKGHAIGFNWVDGAYWSLLVEIRFYLLLFVFYYVAKLKFPISIISTLGLLSLCDLDSDNISKSNDFLMYLPFFAFGMASSNFFRGSKSGLPLMGYAFLIFLSISYLEVNSISMSLNKSNVMSYASCFGIYLFCMIFYRGARNRILSYGGILSFPLYLLHQDIGYILIGLSKSVPAWVGITFAFVIVIFMTVVVNMVVDRYQPRLREWIARLLS